MKILGKIIKTLLWLLLIGIVLVLLTVLSWWMEWPLATGAVILLSLVALVVAFCGLRMFWRWRNKRIFVRNVLEEQNRQEQNFGPSGPGNDLSGVWHEGLKLLRRSPSRSSYTQPWYLVLDDTGNASPLFNPLGNTLPEQTGQSPLQWHFLLSSTLIHLSESNGKTSAETSPWSELLALLAEKGRSAPLRGLVILLSAGELHTLSPEGIRNRGLSLRTQLQQALLTLGRHLPVYVLIQDLECLPGMEQLGQRLPEEMVNTALGLLFRDKAPLPGAARLAAEESCRRLEETLRDDAVSGNLPHNNDLLALENMRRLGEQLETLLESAFRDLPHQITPTLRGMFFCQTHPSLPAPDTSGLLHLSSLPRPHFLADVFSRVLPGDHQSIVPLNSRFAMYTPAKILCMNAWLLGLFALCGLLAVNTIYQRSVLDLPPVLEGEAISHNPELGMLYDKMNAIKRLEQARRSWLLPTLGMDMLGRVEQKAKAAYTREVYDKLVTPLLAEFRAHLSASAKNNSVGKQLDVIRELSWFCDIASDRLEEGAIVEPEKLVFPLTALHQAQWSTLSGELIVNALNWTNSSEQIRLLSREVRSLLIFGLTRKGNNVYDATIDNFNQSHSGLEICLSRFWPHITPSSDIDTCVPPGYTAAGAKALADVSEDILSFAKDNAQLQQRVAQLNNDYYRRYAETWKTFINTFNRQWQTITDGTTLAPYTDLKSAAQLPNLMFFRLLNRELAPLYAVEQQAGWVKELPLLEAMADFALRDTDKGATSGWHTLVNLLSNSPDTLRALRTHTKDSTHLRQVLEAVTSLRLYFAQLNTLTTGLSNPTQCTTLAAIHYGGRPTGDPESTDYTKARKYLTKALKPVDGTRQSPGKSLLYGLLDFIAQGITVQTAGELQRQWENDVLSSPAHLYRPDDQEGLYGENGVVTLFMKNKLKPFLKREQRELTAAVWNGITFPFTLDFLNSLSLAEATGSVPSTTDKAEYKVLLRSQPTLVDTDAAERPDATLVVLECRDKQFQLVNRNYPRDQQFRYVPEQCGQTTLSLRFPSFELSRAYASFPEFLRVFEYGEQTFTKDDFPEQADRLAAARIREIKVRILPDHAAALLRIGETPTPVLLDRITYMW